MNYYKSITFGCFLLTIFSAPLAAQNLQYIVPPENDYSHISSYSEGLAKVEIDYDTTGFLNTAGELIFTIPYDYDDIGSFHCGRAYFEKKVGSNYKYGFINKKGNVVIPAIYDKIEQFSGDRAVVKKGETWLIIDKGGNTIFRFRKNGDYHLTEAHIFRNNRLEIERDDKHGYINPAGKVVVPMEYDIALEFAEGAALVAKEIPYGKRKTSGPIDERYNKLKTGQMYKQWMIIDSTGNVLYSIKEDEDPDWETNFSNGLLLFRTGRFEFGFMDRYGERVVEPMAMNQKPFTYSDGVFIEQVSGQRSDNKDGYMVLRDTTGSIVSKIPFSNGAWTMYDSRHKFHEGLLAVKVFIKGNGRKWGYINKKGKFIIKPQFNTALNFHDGRAVVVTKQGNLAIIKNPLE